MLVLIAHNPAPAHPIEMSPPWRAGDGIVAGFPTTSFGADQPGLADEPLYAIDGELVVPPVLECIDPLCDECMTAWFGLASGAPCDTAVVADRPGVAIGDLHDRMVSWFDTTGVTEVITQAVEAGDYTVDDRRYRHPDEAIDTLARAHIVDLQRICAEFPVGTHLSRLGTLVSSIRRIRAA